MRGAFADSGAAFRAMDVDHSDDAAGGAQRGPDGTTRGRTSSDEGDP